MRKINKKQFNKYLNKIILLRLGSLTEWEKDFVLTCHKQCGHLSEKQLKWLNKIIGKYLEDKRPIRNEAAK